MSDVSPESRFNISLAQLAQAVIFIASMVYGFSKLDSSITFIESRLSMMEEQVKQLNDLQDAPIPSDIKQDLILQFHGNMIEELKQKQNRRN